MICDCVNFLFTKRNERAVQVLRVLITRLIDIQFPEIVLIVRKFTGKNGLNSTWKCTSVLYKVQSRLLFNCFLKVENRPVHI